jgi:hypothetical protein
MQPLVIFLAMVTGAAFGMFAPVLVAIGLNAIGLNLGSTSYEAFIPVLLFTIPLFALGFAVGARVWFSRRIARAPK